MGIKILRGVAPPLAGRVVRDAPNCNKMITGCSAARLARVVRDDEVEGSNPFTPTNFNKMPYFVYILQSEKDGKYYIGSTANVANRLQYHNKGSQRSTKFRVPFNIVYTETLLDKRAALAREKQIKSYKGGEAFKRLIAGVRVDNSK